MHNISKLDVVLNLRGRLKCKHSCIIKCHPFQHDSVTMWSTMKYFMFEVRDYGERTKVTFPCILPYSLSKTIVTNFSDGNRKYHPLGNIRPITCKEIS